VIDGRLFAGIPGLKWTVQQVLAFAR